MILSDGEREAALRSTSAFYERDADGYAARTIHLNPSPLYAPFLGMLPAGASILDAGCGSGRDSLYFLQHGYQVSAFDASQALASQAASLTGLPVRCLRFQQLEDRDAYHGIWACASLLHVARCEMPDVVARLARALLPGGVMNLSFRYGSGEVLRGDRFFNDYNEEDLHHLLQPFDNLDLVYAWQSPDLPPARPDVTWLNALVEKTRPHVSFETNP